MYNGYYSQDKISGEIDCDNDSFMLISVPYDDGWKAIVNGEEVKTYSVNGDV